MFSIRATPFTLLAMLVCVGAAAPPLLHGQSTYTSQLTGVVTDSSGAGGAGGGVVLTDEATNIPITTVTNANGVYVLTNLRPVSYSIRVEAPNFTSQERRGGALAASRRALLFFSL